MLQTIALFFIRRMCSWVMTSMLPVAVTKMSALSRGVVHGHDAIAFHRRLQRADRIDLGHPDLRRQRAQRLRASPCRRRRSRSTSATLPAIITSVARLMPSTSDSRQP